MAKGGVIFLEAWGVLSALMVASAQVPPAPAQREREVQQGDGSEEERLLLYPNSGEAESALGVGRKSLSARHPKDRIARR